MHVIQIASVQTSKDWRLFENIPEMLHSENPYFLPPFPGSVSRLHKKRHPFHRHGEIFPFVALRDGKPVGRIAAIINETHNAFHNDRTGFFGFFDFIDDMGVASHLFEAAEQVISARGRQSMRGPYNPTQNDQCGLLVDGFDAFPFIEMPYNPPYYIGIYEALQLNQVRDLYAFHASRDVVPPGRIVRAADRLRRQTAIKVRCVNRKNVRREIQIVRQLFNSALDGEWGFMPITFDDLDFAVRELKVILDPALMLIAEVDDKPIGFAVTIPNVNEFMVAAKRSRGLLRLLKLAWYVQTRRPRQLRLAILAVNKDYRAKGVAPALYLETLSRWTQPYHGGEISWVQDINTEMIKVIELMGGKRSKIYRILEKVVSAD